VSAENDIFNKLILTGGLRFAGKDPETGENMYVRTELLKDIDPNLDKEMTTYFSEVTMKLWEKGFIDMDITSPNPIVNISERAFDINKVNALPVHERTALKQIIKVLFDKQ
jgi:hypothetical protein